MQFHPRAAMITKFTHFPEAYCHTAAMALDGPRLSAIRAEISITADGTPASRAFIPFCHRAFSF
jgi:hypothetical protein